MNPDPDKMDKSSDVISSHNEVDENAQNSLQGNQSDVENVSDEHAPLGTDAEDDSGQISEDRNDLEIPPNNNFQEAVRESNPNTVPEIKENDQHNLSPPITRHNDVNDNSQANQSLVENVTHENPPLAAGTEDVPDVFEDAIDKPIEITASDTAMVAANEDFQLDGIDTSQFSEDLQSNEGTTSATAVLTGSDSVMDNTSQNSQDPEYETRHPEIKTIATDDVNEENKIPHDNNRLISGLKSTVSKVKRVTAYIGLTTKSAEEKKNEKLMETLKETNVKLAELKSNVSLYEGPKSDKKFINWKEELNKIRNDLIQLISGNNDKNINVKCLEMKQESENILDILNDRANDFEEKNSSAIISRIYEEIMAINNKVENSVLSIDELNRFEKTLMNFLFSLDNVDAKDRPAVKENYAATVKELYDILKLVNEKSKNLSVEINNENRSSASLMEHGENVLTVEAFKNNKCEELIKNLNIIVNKEISNAVEQYNKRLREAGALEKYIKNLEVAHDREKALCETQCLRITLHVSDLIEKGLRKFNREINNDFKEFDDLNKTLLVRKNLTKIQQHAYKVLSQEQINILKLIDKTKGQKELPSSFQTKIDEIITSLDPYKDCNDHICREIITQIKEFVTSISKNLKDKKAQTFINSPPEGPNCDTKELRKNFNSTLEEASEEMRSTTLNTNNQNIRKPSEIDNTKRSRQNENSELQKMENEKYENYLIETQEQYSCKLFYEITSLFYLPEPEEIMQLHKKIIPGLLQGLKTKCLNSNLNIDDQEIKHRFQQVTNKELEKIIANISVEKLKEKKANKPERGQFAHAIGIDLGTTFSCVTVYKNGNFEAVRNFQEFRTTPSVVYIGSDKPVVGEIALMKGEYDPANLIHGIKRIIGRSYNEPEVQSFISSSACKIKKADDGGIIICSTKDKFFKPEEIAAEILKELKQIAEDHIKNPVSDVVVTMPAFFNEPQRRATLEACKLAGLNVLRLLNEPTAAALAYGYHFQKDERTNILVFDFGGGTCDVSILQVNGKKFNVKASYGNNYLGGLDFDNNLMKVLIGKLEKYKGIKINELNKSRTLKECEKAKKRLSDEHVSSIYIAEIAHDEALTADVTRDSFENINAKLFVEALKTVEKCLESADLKKHEIDDIVLAGGSSYIPKMQQMLREYFGKDKLECKINPDESISYGAALQAAILTGECKDDFKLTEITPFSLGINLTFDRYLIVIPKNSEIPCKGTKSTQTSKDYQEGASTIVYQGENPVASRNTFLGEFRMTNITKRKAGETKFLDTFEIDANGILTVTSVEEGKESNKIKITINP